MIIKMESLSSTKSQIFYISTKKIDHQWKSIEQTCTNYTGIQKSNIVKQLTCLLRWFSAPKWVFTSNMSWRHCTLLLQIDSPAVETSPYPSSPSCGTWGTLPAFSSKCPHVSTLHRPILRLAVTPSQRTLWDIVSLMIVVPLVRS